MDQADNLRLRLVNRSPVVEAPPEALRVIAVTSGKGGVGKTNMSANLAALAARAGKRVLIVDADLGLANVDIIFGVKPMHHIGDLLQPGVSAMDVLIEAGPNIHILPAGSGVQRLTELDRKEKLRLVAALDGLQDHFDLVIIDSGAGIGDNVLFFVGMAQEVVLVLSPEPTSGDPGLKDKVVTLRASAKSPGSTGPSPSRRTVACASAGCFRRSIGCARCAR